MGNTIGVIIPEGNEVVARDFATIAPETAFEFTSFHVDQPEPGTAGGFLQILGATRKAIRDAVVAAQASQPDALIMATSAETFWSGVEGNAEFEERLAELTDLNVTTGASACHAALVALSAKRIALLTPYPANAEREARSFFDEAGFDVARVIDLQRRDRSAVAAVTREELLSALQGIDGDDLDAIVQVGTNLGCVEHRATIETAIKAPLLAMNEVTVWHALRGIGVETQLANHGPLFQEH